jgi:hypothetical protein
MGGAVMRDSADRRHPNLIGQLAADRQTGAADRTDQIPAVRELPDLQLLAKAKVAQTLAGRPVEQLDPHVATDTGLVQRHGAVHGKIVGESERHLRKESSIETPLQYEKRGVASFQFPVSSEEIR